MLPLCMDAKKRKEDHHIFPVQETWQMKKESKQHHFGNFLHAVREKECVHVRVRGQTMDSKNTFKEEVKKSMLS